MSEADYQYNELVGRILHSGTDHDNRTGENTHRIWGYCCSFDLQQGFPLLTTKKVACKTAFTELLGFVRGETDVRWYQERGCRIWDADHARWHGPDLERDRARLNAIADSTSPEDRTEIRKLVRSISMRECDPHTLGVIYGKQWRDFGGEDQLGAIVKQLRAGSNSRRLIASAWNPAEFHLMCLPPCHVTYHFSLRQHQQQKFVDIAMWQRSADVALGVCFNWATTAALCHLVANAAHALPGRMTWFGDDVHVYNHHIEALAEQVQRIPYDSPRLQVTAPAGTDPWDVQPDQLEILDYHHHPAVKYQLFVG